MAYAPAGTTSANPPSLMAQSITGGRTWLYISTHTQAEVGTSDFISDGKALGMKVQDNVLVRGSTTYVTSMHAVRAVDTTFTSLSAGLLVSSAS
jgi:hypothetical protein